MTIQPRKTRQKEAIRAAFTAANRPLSHEEVLELAQQQVDGLSIATVYRNTNLLVGEGWLVPVEVPGDTTRYETAGQGTSPSLSVQRVRQAVRAARVRGRREA